MIRSLIFAGIVAVVLASAVVGLMQPASGKSAANANGEPTVTAPVDATQAPPQAAPSPAVTNRANCDQIRGTDYYSPEERQWYLANCLGR